MSGMAAREASNEPVCPAREGSTAHVRMRTVFAVGLAAILGAALWVAVTATRPTPVVGRTRNLRLIGIDRPFPAGGRYSNDPYIGSRVCGDCHPGESALHSRSGHARTLLPAGRLKLAHHLDGRSIADPELPGVTWSYRREDGRLIIARRTLRHVQECVAEYAFGSAHHATTFVSLIDPSAPSILEHRITHFAREDVLDLTPGHETKPPPPGMTPLGGVPPPKDGRLCFGCHATQLSVNDDSRIDEAMMLANVTCERCHGPGRAHVEAALRDAPDSELRLPMGPGRLSADELLRACGDCHRHPAGPRPMRLRPEDPNLVRFQPIGLMQSACYRKSQGAMSCLTCHDPHASASRDRPGYDAACLKCHGRPAEPSADVPEMPLVEGAACPVSPRGRCVECHMPRVAVDTGRHVWLSDHWIRVRGPSDPPAADGKATALARPDDRGGR